MDHKWPTEFLNCDHALHTDDRLAELKCNNCGCAFAMGKDKLAAILASRQDLSLSPLILACPYCYRHGPLVLCDEGNGGLV
jgi:uncharacterized protein YbaR (Trm112 family)